METDQYIWRAWASFLQRWGIKELVASTLEAAGPFAILGAQVIYIGQPFLGRSLPGDHLEALARLLEDKDQTQAFVDFLWEAPS